MINQEGVVIQCCEKLSQQIRKIFKEADEKKAEKKRWQSNKEDTRLKANRLRFSPSESVLSLREAQLNAEAFQAASREIEALNQRFRHNWSCEPDPKQLLKEIDFEQNSLIRQEVEFENIRRNDKKRTSANQKTDVNSLVKKFMSRYNKLKSLLDKSEIMNNRFEITLNEVTDQGSQVRILLKELQTRFDSRQSQEAKFQDHQRRLVSYLLAKESLRKNSNAMACNSCDETAGYYNDVDDEILKERVIYERETNKQLESLLISSQSWLLQEQNFEQEVSLLREHL